MANRTESALPEPFCSIDADEFERALNDPRVKAFQKLADDYRTTLIERGHCPRCLVVNCEHMREATNGES